MQRRYRYFKNNVDMPDKRHRLCPMYLCWGILMKRRKKRNKKKEQREQKKEQNAE